MAAGGRLEQVVGHWMPRIQVAGIAPGDAQRLVAESGAWSRWCATWQNEAARHIALAEEAQGQGRSLTAGEAYTRAALFFHFAQFMFFEDLEQKEAAARSKVETYALAAPLLAPPAEAVTVPLEGGVIRGYLRRPGPDAAPLAVLIPGSDSTKEEFCSLEGHFLKRGLATFSMDGPGQGEGRALGPQRADWGPVVRAVLAGLRGRPGLNGRVGLMGMAFGGHLALQGSTPEISAVVCMNGFFDLGSLWEQLPQVYRDNMGYALDGDSPADTERRAREFTLANTPSPTCPVLVVHGGLDRIFPPQEARRIANHGGGNVELVEYPEGNHVCNNIAYRYRPLVADWMAERLGGRVAPAVL